MILEKETEILNDVRVVVDLQDRDAPLWPRPWAAWLSGRAFHDWDTRLPVAVEAYERWHERR